jgi:hypothetical protein
MAKIISITYADSPDDPIYNEPSPTYSMGAHLWTKRLHDATTSRSTKGSTKASGKTSKAPKARKPKT